MAAHGGLASCLASWQEEWVRADNIEIRSPSSSWQVQERHCSMDWQGAETGSAACRMSRCVRGLSPAGDWGETKIQPPTPISPLGQCAVTHLVVIQAEDPGLSSLPAHDAVSPLAIPGGCCGAGQDGWVRLLIAACCQFCSTLHVK